MAFPSLLNLSIPQDVVQYFIDFFDNPSTRNVRATDKYHKQIVKSNLHFRDIDFKIIRAYREYFKKKDSCEKLLKVLPDQLTVDILKAAIPEFKHSFKLKAEVNEIEANLPLSQFFGKKNEFESLPEFKTTLNSFFAADMPNSIMWYHLPSNGCAFPITKKPALLIRRKVNNTDYGIKAYVYSTHVKYWLAYTRIPQNCALENFSPDAQMLIAADRTEKSAYRELRALMMNKKFIDIDKTVYTLE